MTDIIIMDPMLSLYAFAYKLSNRLHKTVQLDDVLKNVIERHIEEHPESIISIDELDRYIDDKDKEDA